MSLPIGSTYTRFASPTSILWQIRNTRTCPFQLSLVNCEISNVIYMCAWRGDSNGMVASSTVQRLAWMHAHPFVARALFPHFFVRFMERASFNKCYSICVFFLSVSKSVCERAKKIETEEGGGGESVCQVKIHHVKVSTMQIFIHRVTLTPNVWNYKLDNANFFLREWMPNDKRVKWHG